MNLFGRGISKVGGAQCYLEFSQLLLQFIDIAGSHLWNLVFLSNYGHFHLDSGLVNYQAVKNMDGMDVTNFVTTFES